MNSSATIAASARIQPPRLPISIAIANTPALITNVAGI